MSRILFACRPQIFEVPGGDTVQLLKMQKFLAPAGVAVTISPDPGSIRRDSFDLVHIFNLFDVDSARSQALQAKDQGLPAVITTNYWNPLEFFFQTSPSVLHRAFRAVLPHGAAFEIYARHKRKRMERQLARQRDILDSVRLILPNSLEEAEELRQDFGQPAEKFSVVYNAVDCDDIAAADANSFANRYGIRDFVLCAGRFEERKNQLGVARALAGLSVPVVFIGGVPPYQRAYFEACRRAAGSCAQSLFLEGLPQQEVFSAMKAAKVHVLGSWWENTGLVSLEAALCGCNVVTTSHAPWHEYFGGDAWVCDPADRPGLRSAVEEALSAPFNPALSDRIRDRFTWTHAADSLKLAYEAVLQEAL